MVTIKKKPEPPGGKKPQLSDFSVEDITGGATHFYNPNTANMDEKWIKEYPVTFKLKNHWFAKGAF